MPEAIPPKTGISRKTRSDAGKPKNSTMDAFYDRFMELAIDQQETVITILETLHRQVVRGRMPAGSGQPAAGLEPEYGEINIVAPAANGGNS